MVFSDMRMEMNNPAKTMKVYYQSHVFVIFRNLILKRHQVNADATLLLKRMQRRKHPNVLTLVQCIEVGF